MEQNQRDKIIPFPIQDKPIDNARWWEEAQHMINDANLIEMPTNIHKVQNGTIIRSVKARPEMGIPSNVDMVIFYDGVFVHVGGVDSPAAWRFDTFLKDINEGWWEVVGNIK